MSQVVRVCAENEIVKVYQGDRKLTQYICKDNESAVWGIELLADLFAEESQGNGYFHRDLEEVISALSFILNTNFLVNTIETGNVNPLYGKTHIINEGKSARDRDNVDTAKQWLMEHPDNTLGIQKAARMANVNWAAMQRAMIELNRKNPPTRRNSAKVAS